MANSHARITTSDRHGCARQLLGGVDALFVGEADWSGGRGSLDANNGALER
jgi:hypothetical protein